jgi:hypothetical protein
MNARTHGFVALLITLAGCAGRSAMDPVPAPGAGGLSCREAYVIGSRLDQPARIEVWNQSGEDLRIALDGCGRLEHLGWVRSGALTALSLPKTLVHFPGGLRIHAFGAADEALGTFPAESGALITRVVIPRPGPPL